MPKKKSEEKHSGNGGFWTAAKILGIFLLLTGIIVGAFVEHTYVEPNFSQGLRASLIDCNSSQNLLNKEIAQCYLDKGKAAASLEKCLQDRNSAK